MEGTFATTRHDGRSLGTRRRALGGTQIGLFGAVVEWGSDLPELIDLGFRSTSARVGGCIKCVRTSEQLHDYSGFFAQRSHADYLQEVARCTVEREITAEEAAAIEAALVFRDSGDLAGRGRVLSESA